MSRPYRLGVDGAVVNPLQISLQDLDDFPEVFRVSDVSKHIERFGGEGIRIAGLLEIVRPKPDATHATFYGAGGFAASVTLPEAENGILIYKSGSAYLTEKEGGPVRLVIPAGTSLCNNVKSLHRIEITVGKGVDAAPKGLH